MSVSVAQEASERRNAGDSPSVEEERGGQAKNEAGSEQHFEFPVRIIEDPEKAERAERAAEDAAQRERDDLAAQQSMAESTKRIVIISWWQVALASFGTVIVFGSLGVALWANKIAHSSLTIARNTARLELRAYLVHDGFSIRNYFNDDEPNKLAFCIINSTWKNVGRTPASKCNVKVEYKEIVPSEDENNIEFDNTIEDEGTGFTGPNVIAQAKPIVLQRPQIDDIAYGKRRFYIRQLAAYVDRFGVSHTTSVCAVVEPRYDPAKYAMETREQLFAFKHVFQKYNYGD